MSKELQLNTGPYRATLTGLEITRQPTYEEYLDGLGVLALLPEWNQWAIGDMLISVKSHYGDKVYEDASRILGMEYQTLAKAKRIAELFENNWRQLNCSFEHHVHVASIKKLEEVDDKLQLSKESDMDKMQEFLAMDLSVRELRAVVAQHKCQQQEMIRLHNEPEKYPVILADPPWAYDNQITSWGPTSLHYNNMTTKEICELPIKGMVAENAVLFMWVTNPMINDAMDVLNAWGFEYKTNLVWIKTNLQRPGSGFYVRGRHELLFIATRGSFTPLDKNISPPIGSVVTADVQEHSQKPDEVYGIIEKLYPGCKYLELFARRTRQGWESWGDEM